MHQVVDLENELGPEGEDKYTFQAALYKKLKTQNEELEREIEKRGASPVVDYEPTQPAMQ